MKKIALVLLAAITLNSCGKKNVDRPKEPDPIPVKITAWSIGNQTNLSKWNVNVTIDTALTEQVTITCNFTSYPDLTKVEVPIILPAGWKSWYGTAPIAPASAGSIGNNPTFTIAGTKKYKLTF